MLQNTMIQNIIVGVKVVFTQYLFSVMIKVCPESEGSVGSGEVGEAPEEISSLRHSVRNVVPVKAVDRDVTW